MIGRVPHLLEPPSKPAAPMAPGSRRRLLVAGLALLAWSAGLSPLEVATQVKAMGRVLGPPWSEDERLAFLCGWLGLARA